MKRDDFLLFFFIFYFLKSGLGYSLVGKYHLEDIIFKPDEIIVDAVREFFY